jgi:hypothetical protein
MRKIRANVPNTLANTRKTPQCIADARQPQVPTYDILLRGVELTRFHIKSLNFDDEVVG